MPFWWMFVRIWAWEVEVQRSLYAAGVFGGDVIVDCGGIRSSCWDGDDLRKAATGEAYREGCRVLFEERVYIMMQYFLIRGDDYIAEPTSFINITNSYRYKQEDINQPKETPSN
jgi:hypothetical protein